MRLLLAPCRAELVERGSKFLALAHPAASIDDDGEPSGTGGRSLLAELEGRELVDTVVIVARWFGGTKLGTGGLARAYGGAAAAALDAARTRRVIEGQIRYIVYEFGDTGAVARVIEAGAALRGSDEYGSGVRTEVRIPRGSGHDLDRRLRDATAGRAGLEPDDTPDSCWITVST